MSMDRRSFLFSAAVSAAVFFTGCKSEEPAPAPASGETQAPAKASCSCPEGQCACPECKDGATGTCSCAAAPAGGTTSGQ